MLAAVNQDVDSRAARREQILETALRIADRDGFEGLTMRRLASELGVSAPIVYRHFEDKASIIDAIVQSRVEKHQFHERAELPVRRYLHDMFSTVYRDLTEHPGLIELLNSAGPFTDHAMRMTNGVVGALKAEGLDAATSARFFRWLMGYTMGIVMMQSGARSSIASRISELTDRLAQYPNLGWAMPHFAGAFAHEGYDWTLQCMLDVIDAEIARHRSA
jgi:AcrR family transcriptional regulator